jgi:hypothetical protein
MHYFGLNRAGNGWDPNGTDRALLAINHEVCEDLGFVHPNGPTDYGPENTNARPTVEIDKEVAAHGVTIVEVVKQGNTYEISRNSRFNTRITAATRELRIPCSILHQRLPIEYALCHEAGEKVHETILQTAVRPIEIQLALLLANYQPGTRGILDTLDPKAERPYPEKEETSPEKPGANRLAIHCEWKEGDEVKRVPLSAFIQDSDTRKTPADLDTWIFNGSRIDEEGYVAEITGSIISTYVDRSAIINSTAKGNHRDELWISMPDNIPAEETKVTLIITPAK